MQYYSYILNKNYIGINTELYFIGLLHIIPKLLVGNVNTYKQIVIDYLNDNEHKVYNLDVNELVKNTSHDVVYLDSPYNQRQYRC